MAETSPKESTYKVDNVLQDETYQEVWTFPNKESAVITTPDGLIHKKIQDGGQIVETTSLMVGFRVTESFKRSPRLLKHGETTTGRFVVTAYEGGRVLEDSLLYASAEEVSPDTTKITVVRFSPTRTVFTASTYVGDEKFPTSQVFLHYTNGRLTHYTEMSRMP
jgi:hypothetical protein